MATNLDLEEQEQLDQLKAFWQKYGNLITWLLVVVLGGYAAWNGWNWWQRDQGAKAGSMYDQLDKAVQAGDIDQAARVFTDLKSRFPGTAFTEQAGLLTAKLQFEKGKADDALATLAWVESNATEAEYQAIARLRAAGVLLDQKKYDEALKRLDAINVKDGAAEFGALVDDRRGDVLAAQGKPEDAKAAYTKAWTAMDPKIEYRRLIDAKLTALGAAPSASAASAPKAETAR
jgi:predicted negative regulator of RcsB-dependent stress response